MADPPTAVDYVRTVVIPTRIPRSRAEKGLRDLLLSMTGHGRAQANSETTSVVVELRSVNNRYLKINLNGPDAVMALEPEISVVVRQHARRGMINISCFVQDERAASPYRINAPVVQSYRRQLAELDAVSDIPWSDLLRLPGAIEESSTDGDNRDQTWQVLETALVGALENLVEMRAREGRAMSNDLQSNLDEITEHLKGISALAPQVVQQYSERLTERINALLEPHGTSITPQDVVREVGVFADRCDISEEIVRLNSHLDQFHQQIHAPQSDGRKLEFLTQELLRETNTIGAKANDAGIARMVVEIKTAIERIREMVQNIE